MKNFLIIIVSTIILAGIVFAFGAPLGGPTEEPVEKTIPPKKEILEKPEKVVDYPILTILYDNNPYDQRLETAWGFSCLIKMPDANILFDTGGSSSMLLSNMSKLGIDPKGVDIIVISHIHYDHVGGLSGFLKENSKVTVYLPQSLPESVKNNVRKSGAKLVEVHAPIKICKDAYSTGELGTRLKEQSLILNTPKGLVVVTGCAHPGVVNIVKEAKKQLGESINLVLGGFHLSGTSSGQINGIIDGFKREGVKMVAPCHCSGDRARELFKKAYGDNFILVGVGKRLEI